MKLDLPVLELEQEGKIRDLLRDAGDKSYEASGVFFKDGDLYVVFDDDPHVMRLRPDWPHAKAGPCLIVLKGNGGGYEDITYDPYLKRWYCLIEEAKTDSGHYRPCIDVFDESFSFSAFHQLKFPLKGENKGLEGLAALRCDENDYLLGLREDDGRIPVFKRESGGWKHVKTIRLPAAVSFKDYASLDIRNGYMTVVSQASSAMWVGRLRAKPAGFHDLFEGKGQSFQFPRGNKGHKVYCNVEGVAWIDDRRLAVVSDQAKSGKPKRCKHKDQSIHIFKLPDGF